MTEDTTPVDAATGKGRPTPSRKEAEAAAKARVKVPHTRREQAAARREQRSTTQARMRDGYKSGDERYLPTKDKGPVRRYIRDWVDVRFTIVELLLPVLVIALILSYAHVAAVATETLMLLMVAAAAVNIGIMRISLIRQLKARFPGADLKGTTYYTTMRLMQVRFLRLPKPQKKIGDELNGTYR